MPQKIELGVEPHEVVLGAPKLTVRSRSPLDPEAARASIGVVSVHGTVTLSRDGRTATFVPDEGLPPGPHTFVVGDLVSKRGKPLSERVEVPFFVSDSKAHVQPRLRIESIVRLRVDRLGTERLPLVERAYGKYVEVM